MNEWEHRKLEVEAARISAWRELGVVVVLTVAAVAAAALGALELGGMLAGAAAALVVPRAGTLARTGIVAAAVALSVAATGCGGTQGVTHADVRRVACQVARPACAVVTAACGSKAETFAPGSKVERWRGEAAGWR